MRIQKFATTLGLLVLLFAVFSCSSDDDSMEVDPATAAQEEYEALLEKFKDVKGYYKLISAQPEDSIVLQKTNMLSDNIISIVNERNPEGLFVRIKDDGSGSYFEYFSLSYNALQYSLVTGEVISVDSISVNVDKVYGDLKPELYLPNESLVISNDHSSTDYKDKKFDILGDSLITHFYTRIYTKTNSSSPIVEKITKVKAIYVKE
ncbi:MAG: hypothetical protein ACPGSD_14915 [Flavobacteriales bacterium]